VLLFVRYEDVELHTNFILTTAYEVALTRHSCFAPHAPRQRGKEAHAWALHGGAVSRTALRPRHHSLTAKVDVCSLSALMGAGYVVLRHARTVARILGLLSRVHRAGMSTRIERRTWRRRCVAGCLRGSRAATALIRLSRLGGATRRRLHFMHRSSSSLCCAARTHSCSRE
jgi:hypothetical protein